MREVDEARAELLNDGMDPSVFDLSAPTYNWRPAALAVAILTAVFAFALVLAALTGKLGPT